jgi:hypothetical protein
MKRAAPRSGRSAALGAMLALLALAMNLISPPGFMTAGGPGGPTIVICTGHGPAMAPTQGGDAGHKPGHRSDQGGACAFAGHGLAGAPPTAGAASTAGFTAAPPAAAAIADLAPGRGLAAPPPPPRGPPILS